MMEGRRKAPNTRDTTELPGGSKLGRFWVRCRHERSCGKPPYDRLLNNLVLRADYRSQTATREGDVEC